MANPPHDPTKRAKPETLHCVDFEFCYRLPKRKKKAYAPETEKAHYVGNRESLLIYVCV